MQHPLCKLPRVLKDFGQFVACGRVIEREGLKPDVPPSLSPLFRKLWILS